MKDVSAAIIIEDNKILITRRSPGQKLAGKWEFPGGKVDKGETPEECLERELMEELNISVRIGEKFGETTHRYEHGEIRLLAYYAEIVSGEICLSVHNAFAWETPANLMTYDFSPADVPLVSELVKMSNPFSD